MRTADQIISDQLQTLFVGNEDFEELEKSFNVFCPFEAIDMVKQEIRHAKFLAYCLDPQRPHGFGSECLRALMRSIAVAYSNLSDSADRKITPLDVHLMDLEQSQVFPEWRRVDLLIVVPAEKLVIAIELKIDAKEHGDQLSRYREVVTHNYPEADEWRHLFVFLTKSGDDASDDSGSQWISLELDAVAIELDNVVMKQTGFDQARSLLASYLAMLRRHHLSNENLTKLAEKLWNQHKEALDFLYDNRPENLSNAVFSGLHSKKEIIARKMSEASGLTVILDDCTPNRIRLAIAEWDKIDDFKTASRWTSSNRILLVELEASGDKKTIRMRFSLGPGNPEVRLRIYNALSQLGKLTKRKEITQTWTRLATTTIGNNLDRDDIDVERNIEICEDKILKFASEKIKAVDACLQDIMP